MGDTVIKYLGEEHASIKVFEIGKKLSIFKKEQKAGYFQETASRPVELRRNKHKL